MKLEKIRLIALDMDGTVLNSRSRVPEENTRALARAMDAGVEVVINTGRIYNGARLFTMDTGMDVTMITANGSAIFDRDGRRLYYRTIDPKPCRAALLLAEEYGVYYHAFMDNTLYARRPDKPVMHYIRKNEGLPPKYRVPIQIWDQEQMLSGSDTGFCKLMIATPDMERLAQVRARLEKIEGLCLASSGATNIEITASGVDKGAGLGWYCAQKGIPMGAVMAVGDSENDLSMLQAAGWSVAMGNSAPDILKAARFRTAHHDHAGMGLAVRRFVLGEDVGDLEQMAAAAALIQGEINPL